MPDHISKTHKGWFAYDDPDLLLHNCPPHSDAFVIRSGNRSRVQDGFNGRTPFEALNRLHTYRRKQAKPLT